jgi:hypothetical protein
MRGTYDPPERDDDQGDDLKAGEEVSLKNNASIYYYSWFSLA